MGSHLIYGTGTVMPAGSAAFANQIVVLYTQTIGEWSYVIISASAFSIMFGTSIAVFDGYARALERSSELIFLSEKEATQALNNSKAYNISLVVLSIGSFALIAIFLEHFKTLIDLATTISFLIAPLVAWANMTLVSKKYIATEAIPPLWLRILSYAGLVFLIVFALFFVWIKLA